MSGLQASRPADAFPTFLLFSHFAVHCHAAEGKPSGVKHYGLDNRTKAGGDESTLESTWCFSELMMLMKLVLFRTYVFI